ncbi:MAG: GNAT family N-acetyltransferase [Proteobacteria bacterium]|nr:GNAT family N-acetyltransferase [Pseudomonadota bacterium]
MTWITPITLEDEMVQLAPLEPSHEADLKEATEDGELWKLWYTLVPSAEEMEGEIKKRMAQQEAGSMLPFTVIDRKSGRAVGMTTYMNIDQTGRRVEIGSTWYAKSVQRTGLNTRCKKLLLTHAFEELGCNAVEFRTHFHNRKSRRAIERLGAKLDGILRNHMIAKDGTLRDTCVYSIIAGEWPAVKSNLTYMIEEQS